MPNTTMQEEEKWKLPADTLFPATLTAVTEVEIPYTDKKTGAPATFTKWQWEFSITEGEYAGLRAWGDTEDRLTNHPENKVRQWAETLRGAPYDIGEGLDTDDLLGLPCLVTVTNETYDKKDGTTGYKSPVADVFPADGQADEPPF